MSDDAEMKEFLRLVDEAIAAAHSLRQELTKRGAVSGIAESAEETENNLRTLRATAEAGRLPRPSRGETPPGVALALSRFITEWTDDEQLLSRVDEVERYYRSRL